jgi:phosphotransferase system  glucose/maltose/N-acetylglucosamine-specific IIC component
MTILYIAGYIIILFLIWCFIAGGTRLKTPTRGTDAEEKANSELAKNMRKK